MTDLPPSQSNAILPFKRALAVLCLLGGPAVQPVAAKSFEARPPPPVVQTGENWARPGGGSRDLVFIDGAVHGHEVLAGGVVSGAEVVVLDPRQDEVAQIAGYMSGAGRRGEHYRRIHLVSHGDRGLLRLGATELRQSDLARFAASVQQGNGCLESGAELLIYGCKVGEGEAGAAFVTELSRRTGLGVAASIDATGAAAAGGNWNLERRSGKTAAGASVFSAAALDRFPALLQASLTAGDIVVVDAGASAATTALIKVDKTNGNRTTLVLGTTAVGNGLDWPVAAVVPNPSIVYVYDFGIDSGYADAIFSFVPSTGAGSRVLISGGNAGSGGPVGSGPALDHKLVSSLAWDPVGQQILVGMGWGQQDSTGNPVTSAATPGVLKVALNGTRAQLTGNGTGTGSSALKGVVAVAVAKNGTIFIADQDTHFRPNTNPTVIHIYTVNRSTGDVTQLDQAGALLTNVGSINGLSYDEGLGKLVVSGELGIFTMNPTTGVLSSAVVAGTSNTTRYVGSDSSGLLYYFDYVSANNTVRGLFKISSSASGGTGTIVSRSGTSPVGTGASFSASNGQSVFAVAVVDSGAPGITSALTASGTLGAAISTYTITGSNSPTSYNATGLPPGLSVNTGNGQITGTPTSSAGSPYSVTISATNSGGTGSATLVFTITGAAPTVTTAAATSVLHTTATLGGDVTSDGGVTVTERGVVYATTANPTTSNTKLSTSGTTGAFTVGATGLTAATTYHFRAYAINLAGTSYGSDLTFSTIPTATELRFTTQPSGSTSGSALSGQPVVKATDSSGNVDTTFTGNVTLSLNTGAGSLSGTLTKAAVAGIATFTNVAYTATADQQSFTLVTSNGAGLTNATSNSVTSDVVATALEFSTQPVPTSLLSGVATPFTTVPVVRAVNGGGLVDTGYATSIVLSITDPNDGTVDGTVNGLTGTGDTDGAGTTVTLAPASGVATFTGLSLTYTNNVSVSNTIALRATSGGLTAVNSTALTSSSDTTPPTISSISIPNTSMKIGDLVTVTINVASDTDNYTTGSGGISGTIGGFALGTLARISNTQYTAKFTVASGGANVAAGSDIPVSFTLTDSAGNTSTAFTTAISQGSDAIDANRPVITAVSIPNASMKIGDVVTATITVSSDPDTYALTSGTIGGFTLGSLNKSNDTTYTATFTVVSGGTDVAAGANIPVSVVLSDTAGNASTAFTTAISQANDAIDANRPVVTAVGIPNTPMKIGDTVTVTITVTGDTDNYTTGSGGVSGTIGGFALGSLSRTNNTTYTATFTVASGGTDVAAGSDIPVSVALTDSAGNASTAFTTAISQGSDAIDANPPAITAVSIPNASMKIGDVVTATITVSSDADTYALTSGTIGGFTLGSLNKSNNTTYTATFTVTAGGTDVAAGADIPISVMLSDTAGNANAAFTTAISQGSDPIDAHAPTTAIATAAFSADTGTSATDFVTNTAAQTISGTLSANMVSGEVVEVSLDNGSTWATATTSVGANTWSLAGQTLAASNTLKVRVSDTAGNHGTTFSQVYVFDTTAPSAPTSVTLTPVGGTVVANTLNGTNTNLTAGATITAAQATGGKAELYAGATLLATDSSIAGGDTTVTFDLGQTTTGGLQAAVTAGGVATVKLYDAAGNSATSSVANPTLTVDYVAPTATIATAAFSADTGTSATDFITATAAQAISGTLSANMVAGEIVEVSLDNGSTWATATTSVGANTWSLAGQTLTASNTLKVRVSDAAGNIGATYSQAYVLDTTAPTATIATAAFSADTGSSATDFITATAAQTISGTVSANMVAGEIVEASLDNGSTWAPATTSVGANTWSLAGQTLTTSNTLKVRVTDTAGNHGATYSQTYVLDTTAPTATIATAAFSADTGSSATDFITATAAQTISGTLSANMVAGEIVEVSLDNGSTWATATTSVGANTWSLAGQTLAASNTLKVRVTDTAGNHGATYSQTYVLDTTAPTTTIATAAFSADTGSSATDFITATAAQTISGTLSANMVAGEIVEVSLDNGSTWATATTSVGANTWSLAGQTLAASNTLKVRVTDTAGNHGATFSQAYVFDTTAPGAPTAVTLTPVGGTVVANTLNGTNTNLTANATITAAQATGGKAELYIGATLLATDSSIAGGDTSVTFDLGQTTTGGLQAAVTAGGVATVKLYDAAGNAVTSSVGNPTLVVDYVAPTTTVATAAFSADTGTSTTDFVTLTAAQTVSGTLSANLAAGESVEVSMDNGTTWATATATVGQNTWSLGRTLTASSTLKVRVRDAAGNDGSTYSQAYVFDTTAPGAPTAVTLAPVGGTVVANTLNGTNTNLTASATITAGQATGGKAELYIGAALMATDSSIAGGDTSVTFDLGQTTTGGLQAAITAGGVATVKLYDAAGNTTTSSVGNPTLVVDYTVPTPPTSVTLTPVGGTVVANTLNGTNTNLTASATITAGQATGGKAELYIGATLIATDNSIVGGDTSVTFDLGQTTTGGLQAAVTAGGVATVKLYDAAGNAVTSSVGNPTLVVTYTPPTAPTAVTLTPVGGTVTANTLNGTNTNLTASATITAGQATGGKAELYIGATLIATDSSIAGGDTSVTFDLGQTTTGGLQAAVTAGGIATVKLHDAAGNTSTSSVANPTLVVDYTAPVLDTIQRQSPATVNTSAGTVTWRVIFHEGVTGVDATDFAVTVVSGTPSGTITGVTPVSTSVYDVAVGSLAGQGRLRLDLKATGAGIVDLAGNALADGGFTTGDFYYVGVISVFDATSLAAGTTRSVSNATTAKVAQRFTTAAAAPLSLTTVTAALGSITGTPVPSVTIHADAAGTINPTVVATLTNPASLTADALNVWTSTALLSASTTYWVVFADTSVAGAYDIKETAATSGGSGAWLTNPDYVYLYGANAGTGPQAGALQIAIGATSVPAITSTLTASGTYKTAFTYAITATNLPTSYAATGLPAGLSLNTGTGAITGAPTQVGSFNVSLTATNGSGTGVPATLALTVAKAPLTVTAVDATRPFGAANPLFSVNYTGLLGGDSAAGFTTRPTATTVATVASPVGTYAITAAGGVSPNYSFSYVSGTLTIAKAEQKVSFAPVADALIGQSRVLDATADSGLLVTFSVASGPATLSGGTLLTSGAGIVTVQASQAGNSNYLPVVAEQSFVVSAGTPALTTSGQGAEPSVGGTVVLSVETANPNLAYQWQRNGVAINGATNPMLTLGNVQPPVAGLYTYTATLPGGVSGVSEPVIVGLSTTEKVIGTAGQIGSNIVHPNGNVYDQFLLEGPATTLTADNGQVTRLSFVDLSDDIIQVEFSGAGSLSLVMDGASAPAPARNYNQPGVNYVKGHAGIVITGANETSNLSVISVGRINAVNQALFRDDVNYDGIADIAFVAIQSTNGKFGGLRTGNVNYFATQGFTGIYAPGVQFNGPVYLGDINAFDAATPVLVLGAVGDARVTGGNLLQLNDAAVRVRGLTHLRFVNGTTSHGVILPAQVNQGRLVEDGVDITDLIVVNP